MSSAKGIFSKRGRCFDFWADYVHCTRNSDIPCYGCNSEWNDYLECLHRKKEVIFL